MAGLSWTAVTLSLLLYVGNCEADVKGPSPTELKKLVDEIWLNYMPSYEANNKPHYPMFSVAVSIPYDNNKKYDVSGITDPPQMVKATLLKCKVYKSERMVAATVLKWDDVLNQCPDERVQWPDVLRQCGKESMTWAQVAKECPDKVYKGRADHAEYRTLTAFSTLTKKLNPDDFMLFYVLSSPCVSKCTNVNNPSHILNSINEITKWKNYAFVFSNVFMAAGDQSNETLREKALQDLGNYTANGTLEKSIGLKNIIRCDANSCRSCYNSNSKDKKVVHHCYKDPNKSAPSNNLPSTSFIEMRNDL